MGRPRKPSHLKVVSGTAQKCRMNPHEPIAPRGAPSAPAWLSPRATEIFARICVDIDGMGYLSSAHGDLMADYASCIEEIEITTGIIEDLGRSYQTHNASGDVMFRARPEVAQRSDAMRRAQALRAELGLGPASMSKVAAKKTTDDNPFKALLG